MTIDLDKLEALATAVNRGIWALNRDEAPPFVYAATGYHDQPQIARCDVQDGPGVVEICGIMDYLIASQPAVVLELIAELRRLENLAYPVHVINQPLLHGGGLFSGGDMKAGEIPVVLRVPAEHVQPAVVSMTLVDMSRDNLGRAVFGESYDCAVPATCIDSGAFTRLANFGAPGMVSSFDLAAPDQDDGELSTFDQQRLRFRDTFDQFERYGGLPTDLVIEAVEDLTDVNDDLQRGKDLKVITSSVNRCKATLDKIVAEAAKPGILGTGATFAIVDEHQAPAPKHRVLQEDDGDHGLGEINSTDYFKTNRGK